MKRRDAMKLLAASGAVVTASTIASTPAFADGASTACNSAGNLPDLGGETQIQVNSINATSPLGLVRYSVNRNNLWICGTGGVAQPRQWRVSTSPSIPILNVPANSWFSSPTGTVEFYVQTAPNSGPYTVYVEFRAVCCYGGCPAWRCLQLTSTFSMGAASGDYAPISSGPTNVFSAPSTNCESPRPTC